MSIWGTLTWQWHWSWILTNSAEVKRCSKLTVDLPSMTVSNCDGISWLWERLENLQLKRNPISQIEWIICLEAASNILNAAERFRRTWNTPFSWLLLIRNWCTCINRSQWHRTLLCVVILLGEVFLEQIGVDKSLHVMGWSLSQMHTSQQAKLDLQN